MKITVIKKAATTRKPQNFCPWVIEDDAPKGDSKTLLQALDHIGSDRMLLFSTDYPHWQFDGEDVLPDGLPAETARKLLIDNPLETYPRLREGVPIGDNTPTQKEAVR